MFKFIKHLLFFVFVLIVLMLVLSKTYDRETSMEIHAPQDKVFAHVQSLSQWNRTAMIGGIGYNAFHLSGYNIPGVNMDSLISNISGLAKFMNISCEVIKVESPELMICRIHGGPRNGVAPEIRVTKVDEKTTQVTIREHFRFESFFGSLDALIAKYGSGKSTEENLANLKRICEQ
jgi:hypothetical protein